MSCPKCESTQRPVQELGSDMRVHTVCAECGHNLDEPTQRVESKPVAQAKVESVVAGKLDVFEVIRNRLVEVESQIRDVRALEAEAETLRKMLAVADVEPKLRAVK